MIPRFFGVSIKHQWLVRVAQHLQIIIAFSSGKPVQDQVREGPLPSPVFRVGPAVLHRIWCEQVVPPRGTGGTGVRQVRFPWSGGPTGPTGQYHHNQHNVPAVPSVPPVPCLGRTSSHSNKHDCPQGRVAECCGANSSLGAIPINARRGVCASLDHENTDRVFLQKSNFLQTLAPSAACAISITVMLVEHQSRNRFCSALL
jgi:hypothetical protein